MPPTDGDTFCGGCGRARGNQVRFCGACGRAFGDVGPDIPGVDVPLAAPQPAGVAPVHHVAPRAQTPATWKLALAFFGLVEVVVLVVLFWAFVFRLPSSGPTRPPTSHPTACSVSGPVLQNAVVIMTGALASRYCDSLRDVVLQANPGRPLTIERGVRHDPEGIVCVKSLGDETTMIVRDSGLQFVGLATCARLPN